MKVAIAVIGSLAASSFPAFAQSSPSTTPNSDRPEKPAPVAPLPPTAKPLAPSPSSEVERLTQELLKRREQHHDRLEKNASTIQQQLIAEHALSNDLNVIRTQIETEVVDKTKQISALEAALKKDEDLVKKLHAEVADLKKACSAKKADSTALTEKLLAKKKESKQVTKHITEIRAAIEQWEKTDFIKVQHDPEKVIRLLMLPADSPVFASQWTAPTQTESDATPLRVEEIDLAVSTSGVRVSSSWPIMLAAFGCVGEPPTQVQPATTTGEDPGVKLLNEELAREDATFNSWAVDDIARIQRNWSALKANELTRDQLVSQLANLKASFEQRLEQLRRKQIEASVVQKLVLEELVTLKKRSEEEIKNHKGIEKDYAGESDNLKTLTKRKSELQNELRKVVKKAEGRVHTDQVYLETTYPGKIIGKTGQFETPPPTVRQMGHGLTLNSDGTVTRGKDKNYLKGRNLRWKVEIRSVNGHAETIREAPKLVVPELSL